MEQTTKATFNKSAYHPALFQGYKTAKKILKYSFYAIVLYYTYEAFMEWK